MSVTLHRGSHGPALLPVRPETGQSADSARRAPPPWRRAMSAMFTLMLVGAVFLLWPAQLGGSTRLIIVSGHSMEPTYDFGDIAVTRGVDASKVGDPVVFAVPEGGGKGILVIHRIVAIADDGSFVTQGDNRTTPDRWPVTQDDIVGEPVLIIPNGGHVIFFLQQWAVIAVLLGLLTVFLLWPDRDGGSDDSVPIAAPTKPGWTDIEFDQAIMDEANAWLDDQLSNVPIATT